MISVDYVFMKNYQTYLNENYQSLLGSPDDPEVWIKRGYIVRFSLIDFEVELDPIEKVAQEHPKCYQCWYYRRWIVKRIGSKALANELKFTRELLWTKGIRNYLAWSHIQWNINKFGRRLWLDELQFCHQILKKDKYNVWVWDQICRAVRLPHPGSREMPPGKEITFAKIAISAQPGNEGPWIYLKILYADDKKRLYTSPDLECIYVDVLAEAAFRLKSTVRLNPSYKVPYASVDNRGCIHALNLIVDLMVLGYQADRNKRLVEAVDFLYDKYCCSLSLCGRLPVFIQMMNSEISRKVHALMHSFDASRIRYCYMYKEFTEIPKIDTVDKPCEMIIMDIPVCCVISSQLQARLNTILDCFITSLCQEHKVFNEILNSNSELHLEWRNQLYERLCQHYLQKWKGREIAEDDTLEDLMWALRQFIVKKIGTRAAALAELDYTTGIIKEDAYNRHAWSHRQWVFQTFDEDWVDEDGAEIEFCRRILDEDSCNSYAWDQRYFVVTRWISIIKSHCDCSMEPGCDAVSEEVVKFKELVEQHMNREIDYAINVIGSEPENQFPWSHIYGVYKVCYRYSATSFFVPKVGDAILSILQGARDCVLGLDAYGGEGIMGSDGQFASFVNARGVMNALNMLSDIISNRRITTKIDMDEYIDVLKVLCPRAFVKGYEWEIRIRDRTYAILEHLRKGMAGHGLLWENAADGYGFRFCE
ncbi:hypothetical protein CASFOL_026293 [Castilleja foliolosa]|uniref:Protein farnesyltransferase/geranylgeranyltransferase type-1 subunit alpha n=1 Tax=Castilleja foliolosa TaxID=1961234 RepID=A0ABD3CM11_9LAMI